MLALMRTRSLFMVCANPDVFVERGDTLVYCAGALADAMSRSAARCSIAASRIAPIYEAALDQAAALRGGEVAASRVLAIGDSVRTDLEGAAAFGVDCLFVISGIHAEELGGRDNPDPAALDRDVRRRRGRKR